MTAEIESKHAGRDYVVVLRALSSARYVPEGGCELKLDAVPGLELGSVQVRTFTNWVATSVHSLPRELIVEVRGRAGSLEEAITKFSSIARPIATMTGFVANVRVGPVEVHLAYDSTPEATEREFVETFLPDERGGVGEGRIIRQDLMVAACKALLALPPTAQRISRALRQYELALREWYVGGEWLALSHLYIAVETLTEAVIRKEIGNRGITEEQLAQSLGVVTNDPSRPRWRQILGEQVREQMIFDGDSDTYKTAKKASDGLEHGFLELNDITAHALMCTDRTFQHVRRTIVNLLDLPAEIADELMSIKPKDVQSRRKIARGRLIGKAEDPAGEGSLYPRLEWRSSIDSVVREGSNFQMKERERITVRTHPNVGFQLDRLELRGRLEDGQAPVQVSGDEVVVESTPGSESAELLSAVMPQIGAAVGSGAEASRTFPQLVAFNLFGQGVAFFQSAHTLIKDGQPVEALPALRGLTIIAARFEQIADENGPGLGVAIRVALDAIDEIAADPEPSDRRRQQLRDGAASAGIIIPDDLPAPETTAIYTSLSAEMQYAECTINAPYAAVGLHTKRSDAEHLGFHTRIEPGPFTDLVATACVMAQLDLLKRAAKLFGWKIDAEKIDRVLTDAKELNETSANPDRAYVNPQPTP